VHIHWPVVLLSLLAAAAFALSSSLKHVSAGQAPDAQNFGLRKLGRFVRATLSHPLWLGGIACDAVGLTSQTIALHLGDLSVVQPLLVSGLVFALVFRQRFAHQHLTQRELLWIVVLVITLGGFLLLAAGNSSASSGNDVDRLPAVVSGVIGVLLAATCIELGRRQRRTGRTAALLGIAVGIVYAADAAVLKAVTDIGARHPRASSRVGNSTLS
jgi:drug/metabolite transporter (DMT)-like permease